MSYSRFIDGITKAGIEIDRKMLAELGALQPETFSAIANIAKEQHQ
jgi:large subunit ribosomal protein L20